MVLCSRSGGLQKLLVSASSAESNKVAPAESNKVAPFRLSVVPYTYDAARKAGCVTPTRCLATGRKERHQWRI
jgi:hypothetical protein